MSSGRVGIGEFSRLTHLPVKTLRHYHDLGLLVPDEVDVATGYRRYATDQVRPALLIGRLRALDVPLPEVRQVLAAGSGPERDAVIARHLERMEHELDRTRGIVASLRHLLTDPDRPTVGHDLLPRQTAVAVTGYVAQGDVADWCTVAFADLYGRLGRSGVRPAGPSAATYAAEFFTEGAGEVWAYAPVVDPGPLPATTLEQQRFAVATHVGSFDAIVHTYAALGSHVAEHDVVAPGPVREVYLAGPPEVDDPADFRTAVCWPIAG